MPGHSATPQRQGSEKATSTAPRRRNADQTRRLLIEAARARFAHSGYAATTVREIATDAGVNVALINRYFGSKAGLFEACLSSAAGALIESTDEASEPAALADAIAARVSLAAPGGDLAHALLLLLQPSGDESARQTRVGMLRAFGEALAKRAGWVPGQPGAEELLLRAQLILATAIGITALRSSAIEPLASASSDELGRYLRELIAGALGGKPMPSEPA